MMKMGYIIDYIYSLLLYYNSSICIYTIQTDSKENTIDASV